MTVMVRANHCDMLDVLAYHFTSNLSLNEPAALLNFGKVYEMGPEFHDILKDCREKEKMPSLHGDRERTLRGITFFERDSKLYAQQTMVFQYVFTIDPCTDEESVVACIRTSSLLSASLESGSRAYHNGLLFNVDQARQSVVSLDNFIDGPEDIRLKYFMQPESNWLLPGFRHLNFSYYNNENYARPYYKVSGMEHRRVVLTEQYVYSDVEWPAELVPKIINQVYLHLFINEYDHNDYLVHHHELSERALQKLLRQTRKSASVRNLTVRVVPSSTSGVKLSDIKPHACSVPII